MGNDSNTVILRVQLDENKTEDQLKQLVLSIEATRKAQVALTTDRKAGILTDEQFALKTVQLRTELKAQQQEQTALTKNLELYRRAVNGVAGSYDAAQAQLSLAQRQYHQLEQSAENGTEATQALSGVIDGLRNTLKATDAQQSLFVRNVGNYPDGSELTALIQQLVKLEEETKRGTQTTEEANRAQMQIVGFRTQAQQALAKEGKTYEEATNLIQGYAAAIRPATTALVQLEEQQQQVAASTGEASEQVQRIGFQIAALEKTIKAVPPVAEETGSALTGAFGQASEAASVLGIDVGGLESGFARAKKGVDIAKASFGTLRGAMLALPIFAIIAALVALVSYFTKTREGAAALETVMAKVGAVMDVLIDRGAQVGKALAQVFSGDFSGAAETARQSFAGIGDEMQREIVLAAELSKARQQLERDEINNIDTNKRLLNQVERLKNVRDNEFNSLPARKKANEEAYKVELEREKVLTDIATRRAALLLAEINRRGGLAKASNEDLKAYKEAQNEVADIAEDAAGKQNELITNRYQLTKDGLDKEKEAVAKNAERRIALRKEALALEAQVLDRQLLDVRANSDKELSLLQQKLRNAYQAELNVKDLTVGAKKVLDLKYEQATLALSLDFNRRRLLAALQSTVDQTTAQLAVVQKGNAEELRLQVQQIENQRRLALEALAENADNTAAAARINAQATQQRQQAEYQDAIRLLGEYLEQRRQLIERDYATGRISEEEHARDLEAVQVASNQAQAQINQDYNQDNTAVNKAVAETEIATTRRVTDERKKTEQAKQGIIDATLQAGLAATDAIITAFGEESAAGQEALALKKILSVAEIGISLQKQLAANSEAGAKISAIAPPATTALGIAYTITTDALAIASAAAAVANILKFRQGGIAQGPSHEQGGIPLYFQGQPAGIEIEGGEPILTAGVSRSPVLLSMASTINQLAGGKPLVPAAYMAMGGISSVVVRDSLRGEVPVVSAKEIGAEVAGALRKNPPVTKWVDFKAAQERNNFTDTFANS